MPFWWRRRRKPWYGKFRYKKRRFRRRKRRFPRRRRYRKTTRRRRRRKVRRKLKKITLKQWQPDSIKKCTITGFSTLVLGAEGRQYLCWTNEEDEYVPPKAPGGGGFGSECISLDWLYSQYIAHNNKWSTSNQYKDLVRYTGGSISFFRHPYCDFVVNYNLQPPFDLHKLSYTEVHPQNMLLKKRHRVILSRQNKPTGKKTVKIKFKPPKQMSTKWFFQKQFSPFTLIQVQAAACELGHSKISPLAQSQMVTIYYLNTDFWPNCDWGQTRDQPWKPYRTVREYEFTYKSGTTTSTFKLPNSSWPQTQQGYYNSIDRYGGWWDPRVLLAIDMKIDKVKNASLPIFYARYNPNEDTGRGNEVYIVSILQSSWKRPTINPDHVIAGLPLWMAFYGYYSFLKQSTKDKNFAEHYMFVVKSPAIKPVFQTSQQTIFPIVDRVFTEGKMPFDEALTTSIARLWYPKASMQTTTINAIVESGPFIPRYTNIKYSTWELTYRYKFHFKWGGPQVSDPPVDDPKYQGFYPVPDTIQERIQISNPKKQDTKSMLHEWDYRRGYITETALKRMQENLSTDTDFQSDDSETPKKKRKVSKELPYLPQKEEKIQKCLQTLCEEDTYQETPETIEQLIKLQQQQQHKLKYNILQLLTELKKQQRYLGLQTGVLE
nr:MAG: ORF1 [Torque teno midi virus]